MPELAPEDLRIDTIRPAPPPLAEPPEGSFVSPRVGPILVRVTQLPTGVSAEATAERQLEAREGAMRRLREKLGGAPGR